jgi:2-keto-4-pentenoate hydratase
MDHLQRLADTFLRIFREHRFDGRCDVPVGTLSIDDAYEVQRWVIAGRVAEGERAVGYKVGCTSRAIRQQFGLDEPICGRLMAPHVHHGDTALDWNTFHRPAVELEFVLTIGRDLADEESLADAIDCVSPGIEVHNYRFWMGDPTSQELVASNGIPAALVVGERKMRPMGLDLGMEGVGVWLDGELAASGIGAEIMGGPLRSLRWLVNHHVRRGEALRAGQLVIPGSPVGLVPVGPGDRVTAGFTHAGRVEAEFMGGDAGVPAGP